MKKVFLIFSLMCSVAFAATMDDVEESFQKGLQLSNQGKIEEALQEFQKVISTDPNNLPNDYYIQTVSEAYFNIGLLKSKQEDIKGGTENYRKALSINSKHARSLYYLSWNLISDGEIAAAGEYYNKAKSLGFTKDYQQPTDFVGDYLAAFKQRSLTIDYQSYFDSDKSVKINIAGDPIGDDQLICDAIGAMERVLKVSELGLFSQATVEYVRQRENKTIDIERWQVKGDGWEKIFWIKYDSTPPAGFPYKIMIEASEKEIN